MVVKRKFMHREDHSIVCLKCISLYTISCVSDEHGSGVTDGGADLLGKKRQGKKGKGVKIENKRN